MAMPEKPSESAERVHLQWNGGWETWQEVMPQYAGEPGVVTFIRATTHQRTLEALRDLVQAADKAVGHITGYGEASTARLNLRAALARIKGDPTP